MQLLRRKNQWHLGMKKIKILAVLSFSLLLLCCISFTFHPPKKTISEDWETQLNYLNYLIIRASSINIIHGLYLNDEQEKKLLPLSRQIENIDIPKHTGINYYNDDLKNICQTYEKLIELLLSKQPLSDSIKAAVNTCREQHAEIIKRSLLAAQGQGYQAEGCLKCHAPPSLFPKGNISGKDTKPITSCDRKEIDLAHVKGLFGEAGTLLLWDLRNEVDNILTNEQLYIFNSFRCCLIPQEDVADPGIFGQSFVTNEWIEFFRKARTLNNNEWNDYKDLFLIPLRDILEAKLPGIKKNDKKRMMHSAEAVITDARNMDEIDFELQKENLCVRLSEALNVDILNGEANRQSDERKFIAAMFLLFPGSSDLLNNEQ